ncbi:MAG: ribonuclease P protein subunit [Candidatus Heimdallarchaeota archaeon]|nr:ribonuclease P protein subunit [Candidatus Heimdallarchaeota archaeon]MDH5646553.1 ribonuclease P protein subunit [Candidatus Heimdallarchaeota archaeon]
MNDLISKKKIRELLNSTLDNQTIEILHHSDPSIIGIKGVIQLETKNCLVINTLKTDKLTISKKIIVEKRSGKFIFIVNQTALIIDGNILYGNLKTRKKRKYKGW